MELGIFVAGSGDKIEGRRTKVSVLTVESVVAFVCVGWGGRARIFTALSGKDEAHTDGEGAGCASAWDLCALEGL